MVGVALCNHWFPLLIVSGVLGCLLIFGQEQLRQAGLYWWWLPVALVIGFGYASWRWSVLPPSLPTHIWGDQREIRGRVVTFPEARADGWLLQLGQVEIWEQGQWLSFPGWIRLTLYAPVEESEATKSAPLPEESSPLFFQPGDGLQATVKLTPFKPGGNFGDPDFALIYKRRGFVGRASGTMAKVWLTEERLPGKFYFLRALYQVRRMVLQAYQASGALDPAWGELLAGLTIGLSEPLPEEWDSAFRQSGVVHLLVVSGAHFAALLFLLRQALRRLPISLRLEQATLAVVIVVYTALTGATASVMRASVVALLALLAEIWLRRTEWPSVLMLSLAINLIINPYALFELGFQLSYLAAAGIFLWLPFFRTLLNKLPIPSGMAAALAVTLAAQLGVLPWSIQHFNTLSLIAPLANLVCVALLTPLQLASLALLLLAPFWVVATSSIAMLTQGLLWLLVKSAAFFAALPGATWNMPSPGYPLVALVYSLMLWCTFSLPLSFSRSRRGLMLGSVVAWWLFTLWHPWLYPLEIVMLDVGQGDCFFIRLTNGRTVLVDGGGAANYSSEVGRYTIVPFLRRQGIQALDLAIITHPHEDHFQGILQTAARFPVRKFAGPPIEAEAEIPPDLRDWLRALPPDDYLALSPGDTIWLDPHVSLQVISAGKVVAGLGFSEVNDTSVVLRLAYGETVAWLCGDAEAAVESKILAQGWQEPSSQVVLKVAHHGGRGATLLPWLEFLHPVAALISAGESNSYGHPHPETLARLQQRGCPIFCTAWLGATRLTSRGNSWQYETRFSFLPVLKER